MEHLVEVEKVAQIIEYSLRENERKSRDIKVGVKIKLGVPLRCLRRRLPFHLGLGENAAAGP